MAHVPGILRGLSWPLMWLDRRSGFINLAPCVRFILGLTCIMVQNNCSILRFCILSFALWFAIRIEHLCWDLIVERKSELCTDWSNSWTNPWGIWTAYWLKHDAAISVKRRWEYSDIPVVIRECSWRRDSIPPR